MHARRLAIAAAMVLPTIALAQELPKPGEGAPRASDSALFPSAGADPLFPDTMLTDPTFPERVEPPDVARALAAFERAQRTEQRWQKLGKAGVLARVEVERAVLQTARARAQLERARVARQEAALTELRARAAGGTASAESVAAAEAALETARTMAAEAAASLRRTELLFAEANVERQRRLIALGAGSRTQLQRAESTLSQLRQTTP